MNRNNKILERLERSRGVDPKHRGHSKDETIYLTWGDDDEQVNNPPAYCAGCGKNWRELSKSDFLPACTNPVKPSRKTAVRINISWAEWGPEEDNKPALFNEKEESQE